MKWTDDSRDGALRKRLFAVETTGRRVPGIVWTRVDQTGRRPLALVGHGGSQHKASGAVLDVVRPLVGEHGWVVAAIDGPIHGARRADGGADGGKVIQDFRAWWSENPGVEEMVADWRAAIDGLVQLPEVDSAAIGWFGVSMGTAYGIPLCAADSRIRAALLGMWGTSHAHGARMTAEARQVRCPVMFQRKRDDERFSSEGQEELFAALGSSSKELRVYEGGHVDPAGKQLEGGLAFLRAHLEVAR